MRNVRDKSGNIITQYDSENRKMIIPSGSTLQVDGTYAVGDDDLLALGSSNDVRLSWDTTDANANALLVQLPAGGAVNVPVIAIGQSIESVDLGLYNGVVDPTVALFGVGAVTTAPGFEFRKARGTVAAPTVVTTGDDLGQIRAYGAVAAGEYVQAASIEFDMAGTIATTRGPGTITFKTATDAAPSVLTTAMTINAAQLVYIPVNLRLNDTALLTLGIADDVQMSWNIADANANAFHLSLPAGDATNVPVVAIGQGVSGQDLGLFDGIVDPTVALIGTGAVTTSPMLKAYKARGTAATPTVVTTGDDELLIQAFGYGGASGYVESARLTMESTGTIADTRVGGQIVFSTATDAAPSVLTTALTINAAQEVVARNIIRAGTAGTLTGQLHLAGGTSGQVSILAQEAAGTWTMRLPAAVGSAGQQLTDGAGDGVTSWAAASLGEWKNDLGILDPKDALKAVISAPTHRFTYNAEVMPAGQWAPSDAMTGIFAEEAPWAMHGKRDGYRSGIAFSAVNAFGYARAALEALYDELKDLRQEVKALQPA